MSKIKIAIADDSAIFREGLCISLSKDSNIEVIMEANNGEELLAGLESSQPDIIILDIKMPVMNGIETARQIKLNYPAIKVLVLTMYEDEKFIAQMVENGARGYLLKNAEPEEISNAIYALMNVGYYFFDPINILFLKKIMMEYKLEPSFIPGIVLTEEEKLILQKIATEKSTDIILDEVASLQLMKKVGVSNYAGLAMYAITTGI